MMDWLTAARKEELRLFFLAIAIAVAQIILATICAQGESWGDRYRSLCTWDGGWYANIVDTGYHTTEPVDTSSTASNVAFFPAYPVLARLVAKASGWSTPVALLVTAQACSFVFWWLLLRQLRHWRIEPTLSAAVVMTVFCQPAAFYLVVTYADSLFMASCMALLLFGSRISSSLLLTVGAAIAGYVGSASRIVGAPLAALPIVWAWNDLWPAIKSRPAFNALAIRLWRYSFVSLATALGTISFFLYCALRFGHWDLYMQTRASGWHVYKTDYTALFAPQNFRISIPTLKDGVISPLLTSQAYLALLILAVFLIPIGDYLIGRHRGIAGISRRMPFYLAAFLLLFFSASGAGLAAGQYLGFLRYGFYSYVPLLLAVVHARHDYFPGAHELSFPSQIVVFLASAIGLAVQSHFCHLYAHAVLVS